MIDSFIDFLGNIAVTLLFIVWVFGGLVGAIYWAVHDDLLSVVLSIFVPLYGAASMLWDLVS